MMVEIPDDVGFRCRFAMEEAADALNSLAEAMRAADVAIAAGRAQAAADREEQYQVWREARMASKEDGR